MHSFSKSVAMSSAVSSFVLAQFMSLFGLEIVFLSKESSITITNKMYLQF